MDAATPIHNNKYRNQKLINSGSKAVLVAAIVSMIFIGMTRWPVARKCPVESDEVQYLREISTQWFPMHHTLFKTAGRAIGKLVGDPYRGFLVLDMFTSALALVGVWWLLRAIVPSRIATAGAFVLGVGPHFWGYGAIAGNDTAIVLVGSLLMGIAIRGHRRPAAWHPNAAAMVLAIGAGYRSDLGLFWLPTFASLPRIIDPPSPFDRAEVRLLGMVTVLAVFFWFYPATLSAPGWRGELDLALGRLTRAGIAQAPSERDGKVWPTANSRHPSNLVVR